MGRRKRSRPGVLLFVLLVTVLVPSVAWSSPGEPEVSSAGPSVALAIGGQATRARVGSTKVTIRENWPCSGCVVVVPPGDNPSVPHAILVALHGDEGVSSLIASAFAPAAEQENTILFAPQCPTVKGCRLSEGGGGFANSWWGWLQNSGRYDDAWIGQQLNKIAAVYDIDPAREYLTGWSGGADFLGWYALRHADRFAAVAFVAGGVPYDSTCPARKLAAYFLMGSADFRYESGQPTAVRSILRHCGDQTKLVVLAAADHEGTAAAITTKDYGRKILRWLLAHRLGG